VPGKLLYSRRLALAGLFLAGFVLSGQSLLESTAGRYCTGCHNDKLKTGGVSLANAATLDPGTLERVFHKLRAGEMPPTGMPRPDAATYAALISWLETQLDQSAAAHPNPGAPAVHRLNRAEYRNAVRDLLALDLDHSANLPPDDSGYGFDNIGDVLTVSPLHMEKYLANARRIARLALGTLKPSSALERFTPPRGTANDAIDALPLNERGGLLIHHYFPFDADYSILVRVRGNPGPGMPPAKLDLRVDGKRVKLYDADIDIAEANQGTRNFQLRLPFHAGAHEIGAAFLTENAKLEGGEPRGPNNNPSTNGLFVDYVAVGGPYDPKGPGDTESRKRIFLCRPATSSEETTCARKILISLARQAYRRPVTPADIDPLMKLFATGRADGSTFDAGIEMALTAILVSPDFLFRVEHSNGPVTDLELASRLSFFLWSSIPDEELLTVASAGRLHDPAMLRTQTLRLLRDPKSQALLDNFAGQWLQLRNIPEWRPDPQKYPQFDEALRNAFEHESSLFFENIVREDRSVLELIDADYTFVNERLARYYGISGVHGSYFRRVPLSGKERGGVLTQGGVLMVTSYPTRTSPVLRGKWILENILGSPPPPPPPNVPQLEENAVGSAKSLREQLEKHRASAACASCHSRLDPLGFSLENFDGVGRFRAQEGGLPIDASGSMSNGTTVTGPAGLKKVILERKDEFVEVMAGKLLTYALGRGLEYYDQPAVRQIRRQMAADNDRFSSLVLGVVNSVPFQMRRAPER
jgi:cytochrome c553